MKNEKILVLIIAFALLGTILPGHFSIPLHTPAQSVHRINAIGSLPSFQAGGNGFSKPIGFVSNGYLSGYVPYQYNTNSFIATIQINSLYVDNSSCIFHSNDMSFQLNSVMTFQVGNQTYSYWTQNVMGLNTESNHVFFWDNIWNLSSQNGEMLPNTVFLGNGSVSGAPGHLFYGDSAPYFAPGNNVNLDYPSTIELKTTVVNTDIGYPEAIFQYNDGFGWVTYDNVFFFPNHISGQPLFLVSGYSFTPNGLPYDAGIVMGGYGSGEQTNIMFSNVTMGLQYWNGNNYQAPLTACDYGADTAEGVVNANAILTSLNGVPAAHVSYGIENIGSLYSNNTVSQVKFYFTGTASSLTETYDSSSSTYYDLHYADLVLTPGNYGFTALINRSNEAATSYLNISLKAAVSYFFSALFIFSSGLPNGEPFSIIFNYKDGTQKISIQSNATLLLPLGEATISVESPVYYESYENTGKIEITQSQ